jgi:hypothetical protein
MASVIYESDIKTKEQAIKETKLNEKIRSIGFNVVSINFQNILMGYVKNKYNEYGYDFLNRRNNKLLKYAGDIINVIDDTNRDFDYKTFPRYLERKRYTGNIDDKINQFLLENSNSIESYYKNINPDDDNYFFQMIAYTHFLLRIIYDSFVN